MSAGVKEASIKNLMADCGTRTRDIKLGRLAFYHWTKSAFMFYIISSYDGSHNCVAMFSVFLLVRFCCAKIYFCLHFCCAKSTKKKEAKNKSVSAVCWTFWNILLCKNAFLHNKMFQNVQQTADTDLFFASFFLVDFAQQKCKQK